MTDILIQGIQGRMGRVLCDLIAQREDCRVVGGIDRTPMDGPVPVVTEFSQLRVTADVLIDFSSPEATRNAVAYCAQHGLPCVICTTGLNEADNAALAELAQAVPVFKSANMSLGINLLAELAQRAAKLLGLDYDIEIVEKHHHNKVDAPSGTALMLADAIREASEEEYHMVYDRHAVRQMRDPHEIGMHSVRGGSIVGEHEVLFCGPDEVITLGHSAASRSVFANGAINAALFLAQQKEPGMYSMKHLIEAVK